MVRGRLWLAGGCGVAVHAAVLVRGRGEHVPGLVAFGEVQPGGARAGGQAGEAADRRVTDPGDDFTCLGTQGGCVVTPVPEVRVGFERDGRATEAAAVPVTRSPARRPGGEREAQT